MLESNPIPPTTLTAGFTNINTSAISNTIGSIFTPEQVACVCEVLQHSNDIQRLGNQRKKTTNFFLTIFFFQVIFYGHYQHVNHFIIMKVSLKPKLL